MPFKSKVVRNCKYCPNPAKKNIRPDGRNKGYYRTCGSEACLKKQYEDQDVSNKKAHKGKDHPLYKEDRTQIKAPRPRFELTEWRKAVFERDDYTCQMCGQRGGRLQADHIKSYSQYPEERWNLENGRTLCEACHKTTPNYAGRARIKNLENAL